MNTKRVMLAILFLVIIGMPAQSQGIDKDLLIGKWQLVDTTVGEDEQPSGNKATSILTIEKNGRWKSQDKMAVFRGSGTWELEDSTLVRVPDLHLKNYSGTREVHRKITVLTPQKMVFVTTDHPEGGQDGYPKFTFYLTRIK